MITVTIFGIILSLATVSLSQNPRSNQISASLFVNDDLDTWEPPAGMYKDLPYYQPGYDKDGRPVLELGRWNLTKYYEKGDKEMDRIARKYTELFWYRITPNSNAYANVSNGVFLINDLEGFQLSAFTVPGVLQHYLRSASIANDAIDTSAYTGIALNVNFAAQTMFDLIKPFVGGPIGASEFFGTNKARYVARLLQDISREQLPEWYGGTKGFKPAKVFP